MTYNDTEHRILKYLCKLSYGVNTSHVKCLKDIGNDIKDLETNSKIVHTDAVVDMDKLKNLFVARDNTTDKNFDTALASLVSAGYLTSEYVLTKTGKDKNKEVFGTRYNSQSFKDSLAEENKTLETADLLFK